MSKRTRKTTSVSTLVSQIQDLANVAIASGRKDLMKNVKDLAPRVDSLVKEYNKLDNEVSALHKVFIQKNTVSLADLLSENENKDENKEVEVEVEA